MCKQDTTQYKITWYSKWTSYRIQVHHRTNTCKFSVLKNLSPLLKQIVFRGIQLFFDNFCCKTLGQTYSNSSPKMKGNGAVAKKLHRNFDYTFFFTVTVANTLGMFPNVFGCLKQVRKHFLSPNHFSACGRIHVWNKTSWKIMNTIHPHCFNCNLVWE